MVERTGELTIPVRTDEFEQAVCRFGDAVEELESATEELEASGVYIDDPITGKSKRIDASELVDVEISISLSVGEDDD